MSVCLNIGLPIPENPIFLHKKIGVTGFEPAASTSRTIQEHFSLMSLNVL